MWEHGRDENPVEFLDDRGIAKEFLRRTQPPLPSRERAWVRYSTVS